MKLSICFCQGLDKRTSNYLREMSNNIAGIQSPREIVRWAYYEGNKVGEVSPVFDVGGAYVVAVLTAIREKGTIPLAQIKDNLKNFVMNDKKAQYISEKIGNNKDIYGIAREFNTKVDTNISLTFTSRNIPGFGSEFDVIGHIFSMEKGQVSGPVKGNGALFVVALDNIYTPPGPANYADDRKQMLTAFRSRVNAGSAVYNALEKETKIVDNRIQYF